MKKTYLILSIVVSTLVIAVAMYFLLRPKELAKNSNANADVSLSFSTPNISVAKNSTISPKIIVDPTTNSVTAVEVFLTFDTTKVALNSIVASQSFPTILKQPVINNNNGTANFVFGISSGQNGSGPIPVTTLADVATLNITTKSVFGLANVNIATNSRASAKGLDTNVLGTYGQMVVNISNNQLSTPTSTPMVTIEPTPLVTIEPTPLATTPTQTIEPTPTTVTYPNWDVNTDGFINVIDIGLVSDNYDSSSPSTERADVNGDGSINIIDIGIVVDYYQ